MRILRGFFFACALTFGVVLLSLVLVFRFVLPSVLSAYLERRADESGFSLALKEVHVSPAGLRMVAAASGTSLQADGIRLRASWGSGLLQGRLTRIDLEGGSIVVRLGSANEDSDNRTFDPDALAESIVSALASLSVDRVLVSGLTVRFERGDQFIEALVAAECESGPDWSELTATAMAGENSFALQLRASPESGELSLDFDLGLYDWEHALSLVAPEWKAWSESVGCSFYIDPLAGEGSPLVSVSGFSRWLRADGGGWQLAVLVNSGAAGVFGDALDASLHGIAAGVAADGRQRWRAYCSLPVERFRLGNWTCGEGMLELRLDDSGPKVHLETDSGALSLDLTAGSLEEVSSGRFPLGFKVRSERVPLELIEALEPGRLPVDLTTDSSVSASGLLQVNDWRVVDASGRFDWTVRELEWPARSLRMENASGSIQFASIRPVRLAAPSELQVESVHLLNLVTGNLTARIERANGGGFRLSSFHAGLMDGQVSLEPFDFGLDNKVPIQVPVHFKHLDLGQLAKLLPEFEGSLSGRISGSAELVVQPGSVRLKDGLLTLDTEPQARLSYKAAGLLTRGLQPGTPAFERYRMAELALGDLRLSGLRISLFPAATSGQPLTLHITGDSSQDGVLVPVDFSLNVNVEEETKLLRLLEMMTRGELELR